jgi:hypothetical protein
MGRSGAERPTVCRAGERAVVRIVRAFFLLVAMGCASLAGFIALHRT